MTFEKCVFKCVNCCTLLNLQSDFVPKNNNEFIFHMNCLQHLIDGFIHLVCCIHTFA